MSNSNKVVGYCAECGSPLYEGENQCRNCGTWLGAPLQEQEQIPDPIDYPSSTDSGSVSKTSSGSLPLKIISGLLALAIGVLVFFLWQQGNSPRYELVLANLTWTEADEAAHQAGGQLAAPKNKKEMESLVDLLKEKGMYPTKAYLGLTRPEGTNTYYWLNKDGSIVYPAANAPTSWSYVYWAPEASALTNNTGDDSKGILVVKDTFWNLDSIKDDALLKNNNGTVGYIIQY